MVRTFILMFYGWFLAFILYVNFIYAFNLFDTVPSLLPGLSGTIAIDIPAHPPGTFFGVSSFIRWFQESLDFETQFPLYNSVLGSLSSINRSMSWVWSKTIFFFDWIETVGYDLGIGSGSIYAFLALLVTGFAMLLIFVWTMIVLALIIAYVVCFILMLIAFVVELFISLQMILAGYIYSPLPHNPYTMNWFN